MSQTEKIEAPEEKEKPKRGWVIALIIFGVLASTCVLLYFLWFKPAIQKPLSEAISQQDAITPAELPTAIIKPEESDSVVEEGTPVTPPVTIQELIKKKEIVLSSNTKKPICGDQQELMILMVAIDYRGEDYLYGLADVIRLVHVDFTEPRVEVVALPRALLVQVPPNLVNVEGPILLNQGYLFGTKGMGHYQGTGLGAGSLAETIMYNYGINIDQYVVLDWNSFSTLIDKLGGIEVDLPTYVDDRPYAYFPPGKQTLTGEEALTLARIRRKYSDNIRIDNQNIIIEGIINKLQKPETLLKLPALADDMLDMVLTDASLSQVPDAVCMLRNIERNDITFYNPGDDLIYYGWNFIPTMNKDMNIFFWDSALVEWMFDIFWQTK
jgi:LCP family protein required for cell wall assembly